MKILVVSQHYYPEQFRITEICEELVRNGNQVTVLTGLPNYPEGEIYAGYENIRCETINGVNIIRCKIRPRKKGTLNLALNYMSFMLSASRKVKSLEKYDVIYSYQLSPVLSVVPAIKYKYKYKVPLYLYCLDIWPESIRDVFTSNKSVLYRVVKFISSNIYKKADLIGVTSRPFIDYLYSVCKVDKTKMEYLPQHAEDISAMGDLTTIDNRCCDLVFMGNVGLSQDLVTIVDAVTKVTTSREYKVHIVGDGSFLEELKKYVVEKNIEDKVIFHGHHSFNEMPQFYSLSDACLLTLAADSEIGMTVPGKLQGYLAAGKIVIAAINGAAKEVIEEAGCGICVPAGDSEELAKAFERFISNPNDFEECGVKGRKYYEKHFTLQNNVSRLEKSLQRIIEDNE